MKAVLARTMPAPVAEGNVYTFGNLVIDTASHSVKVAGQEAPLTPKEFDLLVFLVNNKRHCPFPRENFAKSVEL